MEMTRNWFIPPRCINGRPVLRRDSAQFPIAPGYFAVGKIMRLSNRFDGSFELVSKNPILREFQYESSTRCYQFCGNPEELPPDGSGHLLVGSSPEGLLFEPVHQIVGQHHQFKVNLCAGPTPAHTLVQSEAVDAFLDEVLAAGPLVVEAPDSFSGIEAACGNDLIVVCDGLRLEQFLSCFLAFSPVLTVLRSTRPSFRCEFRGRNVSPTATFGDISRHVPILKTSFCI